MKADRLAIPGAKIGGKYAYQIATSHDKAFAFELTGAAGAFYRALDREFDEGGEFLWHFLEIYEGNLHFSE